MFINDKVHQQVLLQALDSHVKARGIDLAETVAVLAKIVSSATLISDQKEAECVAFLKSQNTTAAADEEGE